MLLPRASLQCLDPRQSLFEGELAIRNFDLSRLLLQLWHLDRVLEHVAELDLLRLLSLRLLEGVLRSWWDIDAVLGSWLGVGLVYRLGLVGVCRLLSGWLLLLDRAGSLLQRLDVGGWLLGSCLRLRWLFGGLLREGPSIILNGLSFLLGGLSLLLGQRCLRLVEFSLILNRHYLVLGELSLILSRLRTIVDGISLLYLLGRNIIH